MNENISLISKYISIITKQIFEKYGYDEQTALKIFASSETCRMLENPELEMQEFCPDVIFEMWECEQITGNPRNSIYIRSKQLISFNDFSLNDINLFSHIGLKKSFESEFL